VRNARSRRGNALIEFAAALTLLSGIFVGIFQISHMFLTYSKLHNAVRAGARYASLRASNSGPADPELERSVANMVIYGDPRPGVDATPLVSGLGDQNVVLVVGPATATVELRNFEINALFGKVRLDGRPTVTFPFPNGGGK